MQGSLPLLGSSGPLLELESPPWPRPTLKVELQLILTPGSEWPPTLGYALRCGGRGVGVCVPYTAPVPAATGEHFSCPQVSGQPHMKP